MKAAQIKQTGSFGMENRFDEKIQNPILAHFIFLQPPRKILKIFIKIQFAQPDLTEPWTPYVTADQMLECKPVKFNADILKAAVGEKLCQLTGQVGRFCREGMGFTRISLENGPLNCIDVILRCYLRFALLIEFLTET